ncbi:hypothetical protein DENIS_2734 [Desulfonema ishimotonii]|uniref:Uncharacterized protein n=1 Tax=Desulfonema ishimotonii TaxID=45657 RepID=A0A401FXN6_9BACT|nr:hypothetical protein [Desulfonema ishimotonii]GBC61772.1 hypothetical protein DENIS_2734 [Desulfonema ishimotonii]
MKFKYDSHLSRLNVDCPPKNYKFCEFRAFRYTFEDIQHRNNFLPVLIQKPLRANSFDDFKKCKGYGLSFYDSLKNAITNYLKLKKSFKKINKVIGTHIAEGYIHSDDGVVSKVNNDGHLTLHEYKNTDFGKNRFKIIQEIYNDEKTQRN